MSAVTSAPMSADAQLTLVRGRSLFMNVRPRTSMNSGARKREAELDSTSRPDQ